MSRIEVTTTLGPVSFLSVSGYIDATTSPQLMKKADEVWNSAYVKLLLDLGGVDYISSGGLVALQTIAGSTASRDGEMVLCCVGKQVSGVLRMTGLDEVLDIYPEVVTAKAAFD